MIYHITICQYGLNFEVHLCSTRQIWTIATLGRRTVGKNCQAGKFADEKVTANGKVGGGGHNLKPPRFFGPTQHFGAVGAVEPFDVSILGG
jgi:hypothetical protein